MIKKILLMILVGLMLPLSVMAGDLTVSASSPITIDAGDFVSDTIVFGNNGTSDITVDLSSRTVTFTDGSNTEDITVNFDKSSVVVTPGGSPDTTLSFTTLSDMEAGTYAGSVTFSDGGSNSAVHDLTLIINPNKSMTMSVPGVSVVEDNSGTSTVSLSNTGNVDLDVTFSVEDLINDVDSNQKILASAITLPSTVSLGTSETKTANVVVAVADGKPVGTYSGKLTASYDGGSVEETFSVSVSAKTFVLTLNTNVLDFGTRNQNETFSGSFTVTNSGNSDLTNLVYTSTANSKYNIVLSPSSKSLLTAGATDTISVSGKIPVDSGAGIITIGSITVKSDQTPTIQSISMKSKVKGKLEIDDLDVFIDNTKKSVECGETVDKDAKPGDEVRVEIRLRNNFDDNSDEDFEIRDIKIEGKILDIDDGDDLEDETDEFDIDADKTSSRKTLLFKIPKIVDEGDYDVELKIDAEDEKGKDHSFDCTFKINVEKENHDVIIDELRLVPTTIGCIKDSRLELKVVNIGSRDEDEIRFEIRNSQIGINIDDRDIELESGDEDDSTVERSWDVNPPAGIRPGNYPINVKVYRDTNILEDTESVTLRVEECGGSTPDSSDFDGEENDEEDEVIVVTTSGPTPTLGNSIPPVADSTSGSSRDNPFTESSDYTLVLILANVILFGIVVAFVAWLLKK